MMKTKNYLAPLLAAASLLAAATTQVQAQAPGGGPPGPMLTPEQRAKLREAMQGSQTELNQLNEKLAAAQKEAIQAALAPNADEKTVRAKIEAVSKIQTDIAMLRFKALKEVAPTFTEEQKTQLQARPQMAYGMLLGGPGAMMGGFGGRGLGAPGGPGGPGGREPGAPGGPGGPGGRGGRGGRGGGGQ